jgi:hypothetical protein
MIIVASQDLPEIPHICRFFDERRKPNARLADVSSKANLEVHSVAFQFDALLFL